MLILCLQKLNLRHVSTFVLMGGNSVRDVLVTIINKGTSLRGKNLLLMTKEQIIFFLE